MEEQLKENIKETVTFSDVFRFILKKWFVPVILAAVFWLSAIAFINAQNNNTKAQALSALPAYQYSKILEIELPRDADQSTVTIFTQIACPMLKDALSSFDLRVRLYNELGPLDALPEFTEETKDDFDIFLRSFTVSSILLDATNKMHVSAPVITAPNAVAISCVSLSLDEAEKYVNKFIEMAMPKIQKEMDALGFKINTAETLSGEYVPNSLLRNVYENKAGLPDEELDPNEEPEQQNTFIYALFGLLFGVMVLLVYYWYSQNVKNATTLESNFPEIPVLAYFKGGKNAAAANFTESLRRSRASEVIVTSSNPKRKSPPKLPHIDGVSISYINYAGEAKALYSAAKSTAKIIDAEFTGSSSIGSVRQMLYHLNQNNISVDGFILFD